MAKRQIVSTELAQPSGVFSHATTIAAKGTLVFVSGMVAKRPDGTVAGIGDISEQTTTGLREPRGRRWRPPVARSTTSAESTCHVRNMEHFPLIHECAAVLQRAIAGIDDGRGARR